MPDNIDDLIIRVEREVRHTIDHDIRALQSLSEADYCHVVLEALSVIVEGLEMRAQELEQENEEE